MFRKVRHTAPEMDLSVKRKSRTRLFTHKITIYYLLPTNILSKISAKILKRGS